MKKMTVAMAVLLTVTLGAVAATTPVELSLFCKPLSIPWCQDVSGFRLDLLSGINRNVSGLDIGTLVNIVDEKATGLELCGFYNHIGEGRGLFQIGGLLNRCDKNYKGLQISSIYNEIGGELTGAELSLINQAKTMRGLQLGVFNTTDTLVGMQIGIVNFAENADNGVQVGIVNVMPNGELPVTICVNIGF